MSVAYYGIWPKPGDEDSTEVAAKIAGAVNARLGGTPPAGGLFHAEGPADDGGWWVFNLWESDDAYHAFVADILIPAMSEVGVTPAGGDVRRLDVWWDSTQMMAGAPQG